MVIRRDEAYGAVKHLVGLIPPACLMLLGSCFSQENDRLGEVAQSFGQLPPEACPTVTILITGEGQPPWGVYTLRQPAAAVTL